MVPTSNKKAVFLALSYAWEFGYTVAVPVLVFTLIGRWLDRVLHTSPWLLLTGLLLSIIATSFLVVRKALRIFKEAERDNGQPPTSDHNKHPTE